MAWRVFGRDGWRGIIQTFRCLRVWSIVGFGRREALAEVVTISRNFVVPPRPFFSTSISAQGFHLAFLLILRRRL